MDESSGKHTTVTRRQALRDIGAAGVGLTALGGGLEALLAQAAMAAPKHGSLKDIEHVIIFMQENRSFDHYFGTLRGVRGFGDKRGRSAFFQKGTNGKTLAPFRLPKQCLPDITHDWGPQHRAWHSGKMDRFLSEHETTDGPADGPETIGYYTRADIGLYYSLADAFTICDGYHCSVIGPTDPNRLMSMSASIDPAGKHGGPLLETLVSKRGAFAGKFTWTTMPERLESNGVSWKFYQSTVGGALDNVLPYFKAFNPGNEARQAGRRRGTDVSGRLPGGSLQRTPAAGVVAACLGHRLRTSGFLDAGRRTARGATGCRGTSLAPEDLAEDRAVHHLG